VSDFVVSLWVLPEGLGPAVRGAGFARLGITPLHRRSFWPVLVALESDVRSLDVLAATSPDLAIARAGTTLKGLGVIMGVLAIGTSLYTARSCARVLAHRQIPPPGSWVMGGPKVIYGTRAVIWGRVGYALAGLLAILGGSFTYLIWQFVDLMMAGVAS